MSGEERARAAGETIRSCMIGRQRVWLIGFVALCLSPFATFASALWLTLAFLTLSMACIFRVMQLDARADRARATLLVLSTLPNTQEGRDL